MNKTCTKCNKVKPLSEFGKNKTNKDGLQSWCKSCRTNHYNTNKKHISEYSKLHYQNNKEAYIKRAKLYKEIHKNEDKYKEMERNIWKRSHLKNKVKRNTYSRMWAKKNKETRSEYHKQWCKDNADTCREYARKRRALKEQVKENYTKLDEQYTMTLFNNTCANWDSPDHVCSDDLCIDHHKPLSKGYPLTRENAVVLCRSCNCSKGNKLPEDFYPLEVLICIESILNISLCT